MGLSTLVHLTVAEKALKGLSFKRLNLRPGMEEGIDVSRERLHVFDPQSERRLN